MGSNIPILAEPVRAVSLIKDIYYKHPVLGLYQYQWQLESVHHTPAFEMPVPDGSRVQRCK